MITKTAVTAWKLMMPYLSEDAQKVIIRNNIRKPLAQYNNGVAKGSKNLADKYGIQLFGSDPKYRDFSSMLVSEAAFYPNGKHAINKMGVGITKAIPKEARDAAYFALKEKSGAGGAAKKLFDTAEELATKYKDRGDSVPMIALRKPFGTAKDDFVLNTCTRHELSEGKHFLSYYDVSPDGLIKTPKRGVDLARPNNRAAILPGNAHSAGNKMGHASLGVLKDELKDVLRSGHIDLHRNAGYLDDFRNPAGILQLRSETGTNELPYVLRAGKEPDVLGGEAFVNKLKKDDKKLHTRDIKRMQKHFFRNLDEFQKAKNVPNTKPSSLFDTSVKYMLPDKPGEYFIGNYRMKNKEIYDKYMKDIKDGKVVGFNTEDLLYTPFENKK